MKQLFILAALLLFCTTHAQVVSIDYVLGTPVQHVSKIKIPKADSVVTLSFEFGKSEIDDEKKLDSLRHYPIDKIVLVYTGYKQEETFSQDALNRKRLEFLKQKVPFIFENNLITWEIVEQTGAKTDDEAKTYFHGFIIYFKTEAAVKVSTEAELISLTKGCAVGLVRPQDTITDPSQLISSSKIILDTIILRDSVSKITEDGYKGDFIPTWYAHNLRKGIYLSDEPDKRMIKAKVHIIDTVVFDVNPKIKRVKVKDEYLPRSTTKRKEGIIYTKKTILNRRPVRIKDTIYKPDSVFISLDTVYQIHGDSPPVYNVDFLRTPPLVQDTVVKKKLGELKDYQNTILVEDVTGSMMPYTLQTFLWRRVTLASTDLSHFIFFNDGDSKSDGSKVIGRTGGIYYIHSSDIDSVEDEARLAMKRGNGGDCPENNLEAIIYAIHECHDCHILMIADNNAPVKDIALLESLDVPVDIILCGVYGGRIQSDYMEIARATGGTISTMEKDLKNEFQAAEGSKVEIGGQSFLIKNGKFVLTR